MRRLPAVLVLLALPSVAAARIAVEPVREVIRAHQSELASCYERYLTAGTRGGRLVVEMEIAPDGHVPATRVTLDEIGDPTFARCVTDAVQTWQFPDHDADPRVIRITYPFVFRPG
jgi:hypothetical protein